MSLQSNFQIVQPSIFTSLKLNLKMLKQYDDYTNGILVDIRIRKYFLEDKKWKMEDFSNT